MSRNSVLVFLLISIIIFLSASMFIWDYSIDDAFVTFSYAGNLADGNGLVFRPDDKPVEAYSNFLWLLILTICKLIGLPIVLSSKILGLLFTISASLIWFYFFLRNDKFLLALTGPIFLICPYTAFWSLSGLELGLNAFLFSLAILFLRNKSKWLFFVLPLIVLNRPEGFAVAILILIITYVADKKYPKLFMVISLAITITAIAALSLFRIYYFGYPFPNTVYAKSSLSIAGFMIFLADIKFLIPWVALFLISTYKMFFNKERSNILILSVGLFFSMIIISSLAEPVMNFNLRYMMPFLPFLFIAALYAVRQFENKLYNMSILVLLIISTILPFKPVYDSVIQERKIILSQNKIIDFINNKPGDITISMTDMGRIPFYTNVQYNDLWGLTSLDIAHDSFNTTTELTRFPEYFILVGNLSSDKVTLRFGKERMLYRHKFFGHIYQPVFSTQNYQTGSDISAYNYIAFKKDQPALDSLLKIYPLN